MSLTLTVLTYRNQPPARAMSATFTEVGGTIGRLTTNTLELPDPEHFISRTHAKVTYERGSFIITNNGQNPIDLNGRLLGIDERARLSSGDRVTIGDYLLESSIGVADAGADLADILNRPATLGEPLTSGIVSAPSEESAFGIPLMGGAGTARPSSRDLSGPSPVLTAGQQRDRVPGFRAPLTPAAERVPIPADFDLLQGLQSETPAQPSAPRAPAKASPELAVPEDPFSATLPPTEVRTARIAPVALPEATRPAAPRSAAISPSESPGPIPAPAVASPLQDGYILAIRSFLTAAGVPELEARALADPDFMLTTGELLREAVAGLLKALVARALTKGELRLDMTMLAPTENNPLKFSPNAHEALTHLLAPRPGAGYLPPLNALREAYQDLEAHNLAVMAGMRAALLGVLERFDPQKLEQRLTSRHVLDKLLPLNRKARMWDLVAEQHADLVREAQDEFDRMFGRAFRDAYHEQVEKLRAAGRQHSSLL